ncbi:kinase-like domain-containing protein [Rhodofomes roseus]|uniref:Kinase-like domain-containing protein n=1 Tax=Rhodofomes roseus TaxID=34475 RepID=A0ABQ8K3D9_9APHY|nr:kinase-like domain-containing protein [Rhodofomes roseus]KAH9831368.1 kinase-like domain-containing protein [Rhodofomes roseus]
MLHSRLGATIQSHPKNPECSQTSGLLQSIPKTRYWYCVNRIRGYLHSWFLIPISKWDCRRHGIPIGTGIWPLPFNLLLKRTEGTRETEAIAMMVARDMGLPVPRMLSYADHGRGQNGSILMERLPGKTLFEVITTLSLSELERELESFASDLEKTFPCMRMYSSPYHTSICGVDGQDIRSIRLPNWFVGPCPGAHAFYDTIQADPNPPRENGLEREYPEHLANYQRIYDMAHTVVLSHGDLAPHNILVMDGHITGVIDWEAAGWYPEYWEYTTMLKGLQLTAGPDGQIVPKTAWQRLVLSLPSFCYATEYDLEWSLWWLTMANWPPW